MSNEIWRDIQGYENRYKISNHGRVKSFIIRERELAQPIRNGYCHVDLCKNGKIKSMAVHRLVCSAFHANPLNKPEVNHKDCNRRNNHVDNLEWTTRKENAEHAAINGLYGATKGETHPFARLTEKDVLAIREHKENGMRLKDVAKLFNMSRQAAGDIVKRKTWKHI